MFRIVAQRTVRIAAEQLRGCLCAVFASNQRPASDFGDFQGFLNGGTRTTRQNKTRDLRNSRLTALAGLACRRGPGRRGSGPIGGRS